MWMDIDECRSLSSFFISSYFILSVRFFLKEESMVGATVPIKTATSIDVGTEVSFISPPLSTLFLQHLNNANEQTGALYENMTVAGGNWFWLFIIDLWSFVARTPPTPKDGDSPGDSPSLNGPNPNETEIVNRSLEMGISNTNASFLNQNPFSVGSWWNSREGSGCWSKRRIQ